MKTIISITAIILLSISCKKLLDRAVQGDTLVVDGFSEYVIDSGAHYTNGNGYKAISNTKSIHFIAWFDSTCIYKSVDPNNQGDINKLYGFSDCNTTHQESSARVGWSWNGHSFDLYAYCYVNSLRQSKLLGSIKPRERADLTIAISGNKYHFTMNGRVVSMDRECSTPTIEGYQLYPYFGGDEVAPHAMRIYIKEL